MVYPAAFSYRQGIELYVKHLLRELSAYNKSGVTYRKTHKLQDNWALLAQEATRSKLRFFDHTELAIAGDIIAGDIIDEFCEIDPTCQVFRYPGDIRGHAHLEGLGVINVEVLADGMTAFHEWFENWRCAFDDLKG